MLRVCSWNPLSVCVSVSLYQRVCIWLSVCGCLSVSLYVYLCVCGWVCECLCLSVSECVSVYLPLFVCVCVCGRAGCHLLFRWHESSFLLEYFLVLWCPFFFFTQLLSPSLFLLSSCVFFKANYFRENASSPARSPPRVVFRTIKLIKKPSSLSCWSIRLGCVFFKENYFIKVLPQNWLRNFTKKNTIKTTRFSFKKLFVFLDFVRFWFFCI